MFIRWQRRPLQRRQDTALRALLVQSVRVAGRPRQRLVGYLASIREQYREAPAHRQRFWYQVDQRLASLGLDPPMQATLEACLAQQVPRPTPADLAALDAQYRALSHLAATLGRSHDP